jgi:hypothetical protein
MGRYVVTGGTASGAKPAKRALKRPPGVKIVSQSETAVLVEADEAGIDALRRLYPDATIAPEVHYSIPRQPLGVTALRRKHAR